jgi:sodium/proline symporter
MLAAVMIGLIGRSLYPAAHLTAGSAENIFISITTNLLPPVLAGLAMAGNPGRHNQFIGFLSSDRGFRLFKNLFQGVLKKDATDSQIMRMTRITLLTIAALGMVIAMDETSIIFRVVSFAWAGFGATFGPIMLFSLFWRRTTLEGAIAGMLSGGVSVFAWKLLVRPLGGIWNIYELLPAFIISAIFIVAVSLVSREPSEEMRREFDSVGTFEC